MGYSFHIRNVPEGVVNRLKQMAEQHHRSVNAEIVAMLKLHYADEYSASQLAILERIRRRKADYPPSDPAETSQMIHEDRRR